MFNSLKSKFIISFITLELIILSLLISLNFNALSTSSKKLIDEKNEISSQLLMEIIKGPMIIYDLATIDDAIKTFSALKNVIAVRIDDSMGVKISSYLKEATVEQSYFHGLIEQKFDTSKIDKKYIFKSDEIKVDTQKIGDIYILYSVDDTNKIINHNTDLSLALALASLIIGFIISYLVGSRLGKSLEELSKIANSVSNDIKVDIPYSNSKNDEMNNLFFEMHKMQEHILHRTRKLNDSNNDLQQYVNALNASAIVSKTDKDGNIISVNKRFCEVTGFSEEELLGKTHSSLRDPQMDDSFYAQMWETITNKNVYHNTFKNIKKTGEAFYVDATISPLLDNEGNIQEYIAIRFDVTELVDAKNRAEEAKKIKEQFLSNMSHEIRTPLNAIMGFIQILQKRVTDEKNAGYLKTIQTSSQSLLYIINDILDISKIESAKLVIDAQSFNPTLEFKKVLDIFSINAKEKSIDLSLHIEHSLPECLFCDLLRIKQIMFNLLSNAIKFTPEHKKVAVTITYNRDTKILNISVKDEGIGISEESQNKIFAPFEQADNSTARKFGGTGLGLSISLKLAQLMNGAIILKSEQGVGSEFTLSIPIKECSSQLLHEETTLLKQ
jgi:PAS domain S-box-containing protein